jgi:plastocyanin
MIRTRTFRRFCTPLTSLLLMSSAGLSACSRRDGSTDVASMLAPIVTPEGFEAGKLSITGRITLKGSPPRPDSVIDSGGDPFCKNHGPIQTENWKVSADGGLAEAVIAVIDAPPTAPDGEAPHITQEGCRYIPHVVAVARGRGIEISNGDKTFHNVRVVRHQDGTLNRGLNLINYSQSAQGSRNTHRFDESGVFRLECDVHRWMQCWVYVADNNHVAVSADDGTFQLNRGLRDGTYTVRAWHHHFREPLTRAVNVVAGRAEVNFQFEAALAMN